MNSIPKTSVSRLALAAVALAVPLLAPAPAHAQVTGTQLLNVKQKVPLAAVLDNPCTAAIEAISFSGTVDLTQEVWKLTNGNLRLIVAEATALKGTDTLLGAASPTYTVNAPSHFDAEFAAMALVVQAYKKVQSTGTADNFHVILSMSFDPKTLQLQLGLLPACDAGRPETQ